MFCFIQELSTSELAESAEEGDVSSSQTSTEPQTTEHNSQSSQSTLTPDESSPHTSVVPPPPPPPPSTSVEPPPPPPPPSTSVEPPNVPSVEPPNVPSAETVKAHKGTSSADQVSEEQSAPAASSMNTSSVVQTPQERDKPVLPPPDSEVAAQSSNIKAVERIPKLQIPTITSDRSCPKHHMLEQMFCEKCDNPICPACLQDGHNKHTWQPKSKYVEHIAGKVQEMTVLRQQLASIIKDSEQRAEATTTQQTSTEEHIRRQADRLHSMINEQQAVLLQSARDASGQQLNLLQQRKELAVQFDQFFAEASVYCDREKATEGVGFYKQLANSVTANLKDGLETINTPLPAEAQIDVVTKNAPTERIVQSIQAQFGQVVCLSQPAGPSDINITGTGGKRAIVGMPSKFEVSTIKNPSKLPCVFTSDVSCVLVPRHNKKASKIMCECKKEAEDRVVVSYTANESGEYQLQVELGGASMLARPATVMIAPPFAYEKKVTVVKRLHGPTGVAVRSNETIVLTESASNSVTLKELGKTRRHFGKRGSAEGQLLNPTAIATVPGVSQVIVVDTGNHRIQKFDLRGQLILGVGSKGQEELEFDTPVAIAVDSKKRVYVAEAGNGRIQVLSSDFFFHRFIRCPQGMIPTSISVDSEDNLYVSYRQQYVQKLKPDGQYIGNIGAMHLADPSCLTVSPLDLLYVGDKTTSCVLVFSTDGEFLYQMDNRSESVQPPEFGCLGGLAVDSKNNLYVSDTDNGRLLVFKQIK